MLYKSCDSIKMIRRTDPVIAKNLLRLPTTTSKGRIFNIVVKGEIVNYLQSMAGLKLEGGAFLLNAKYLPGINCINTVMRIGNHSINTIIQKLEEEKTK